MQNKDKPSRQTLDEWHSDPNNWKLGVFYYNKLDKRLFPPKRIGWTGWTVNFANPKSISALILLILILLLVSRFLP
jgi:uncharacterized membrane protein